MSRRWTAAETAQALDLEAQGLTQREIGRRLDRSTGSVQTQLLRERKAPPTRDIRLGTSSRRTLPYRPTAIWFGKCTAFRPRTDDDANRATRL